MARLCENPRNILAELCVDHIITSVHLMSTALPTSFSVDGSVTANGVNGVSAAAGQTVINIYPQTLDEATIDYLFVRFNARLGAAI